MKILSKHILCGVLSFLVAFSHVTVFAAKKEKEFTVVIDAGHGGHDVGAVDNGVKEKDINLAVAQKLAALISTKMKDAEVVMTRKDDRYITLQQRADIANNAKGDLFISIHTNSVDKSNPNRRTVAGTSVYALGPQKEGKNMDVARRENSVIELEKDFKQKYSGFDPNKDESYIIFEMAQKKNLGKSLKFANEAKKSLVANAGRKDRGVKQAGFWVLWATSMPAVLVELDFICNPLCAEYMGSDKGRDELAQALFKALQTYRANLRDSQIDGKALRDLARQTEVKAANEVPSAENAAASDVSEKKPKSRTATRGSSASKRRRRSESAKNTSDESIVESKTIAVSRSQKSAIEEDIVVESTLGGSKTIEGEGAVKSGKKAKKAKADKKKKNRRHKTKCSRFVKVYKIQLLASADRLKQNNPRFCGFGPISAFRENNLYKYTYGESQDKGDIEKLLKEVKKKIPDAFIISIEKEEKSK